MRSTTLADGMADGIDAAPMPAQAPDGGLAFEPARPKLPPPPRLCEAGPCRHYHRLAVQIDAANAMAEQREDGTVVHHARSFFTEVQHYCYPDVGIETVLGSMPVLECNRWVPVGRLRRTRAIRREYERALDVWHDDREHEADELNEAVAEASAEVELVAMVQGAGMARMSVSGDMRLDQFVQAAFIQLAVASNLRDPDRYEVSVDGEVVTNRDITIAQLGLESDAHVIVTFTNGESA